MKKLDTKFYNMLHPYKNRLYILNFLWPTIYISTTDSITIEESQKVCLIVRLYETLLILVLVVLVTTKNSIYGVVSNSIWFQIYNGEKYLSNY